MKKVILAILDGVGIREESVGNAVKNAETKALDKLIKEFPNSKLSASGEAVGLPKGQMGNSEVGHITIGAGQIVNQPLQVINKSLEDGSFYCNEEIIKSMEYAKNNDSKLHILGLLSDGGVHSHINHIFALIKMAKNYNIKKLYIHAFLDGRDVPYNTGATYLNKLKDYLNKMNIGKLATISGRYYAMDREKAWDRTKKCYDAIVNGEGIKITNYETLLNDCYRQGIYDEFIPPAIINEEGLIEDKDSIIVANFRPDRIPQLFEALAGNTFTHFPIKKMPKLKILTMMPINEELKGTSAFHHQEVTNTLGEVLENNGYRTLRIAETSKFPHVTHFIDGDRDIDLKYTTKIRVPRKEVATYDLAPEMSAFEVTDKIKYLIDDYDFVIVNYANGDMVGHTGNYKAAIKAIEAVDKCIQDLYELCFQKDILLIITADHGNCEEMVGPNNIPHTYHTTNKVPFIVCDKKYKVYDGELSDIAPSILNLLNLEVPENMTGNNIIREKN